MATPPILSSLIGLNAEGCGLHRGSRSLQNLVAISQRYCQALLIIKASCIGSNGKNWLLNPESSSQSEGYSSKWLIWLVVREPLLQETQSASLDQTCSAWAKINKNKRSGQTIRVTMSKILCYSYDLCSRFWPLSAFGGYFVQIAVLWGRAGCPLSGVKRCPLLGGSKCIISMGRAIKGMEFVCCTEVVHLSESPLLEVSLYTCVYKTTPKMD